MMLALPLVSPAAEYEQSLLVETGKMREGDLMVRNDAPVFSPKP